MVDSTLIILWIFSWLAVTVMLARLVWRYQQMRSWNAGDYLTLSALVCVFVRLGMIHIVLTYGTNNMTAAYRATHHFTSQDISKRVIGSKLAVANRFFYNTYLWLQKLVLLDLYRRLYLNLRWERGIYQIFLVFFAVTYFGTQISNISECRPTRLYWQVIPDPGSCVQAKVQLLVLGILNIVTDAMLLALPWPLIINVKLSWQRKAQMWCLFLFGFFIIAITCIRLPINDNHISSQVNRTTWASTELLTSALVVNAPTLYSLWNKRHMHRGHQRVASNSNSDDAQGPPRVAFRESYFGPGPDQSRRDPWKWGAIKQTRSVQVVEHVAADNEPSSGSDVSKTSSEALRHDRG
ncbi:hypothetical protein EJ03DRAFT_195191 [Teratosphaeria nubilosa]|uniref:Rhodopsin domain-containing protein n=1 Tax=Teratosphaeria nubilosa TaxID=161662 RepID=A0A6G1KZ73_9PEZI|nr:hypothetical protein EJ03DRAFT_195191 [Teratosphaeria nubilosa]